MNTKTKAETDEVEKEADVETEETTEESEETEESTDESTSKETKDEIDYDSEIEAERKRGKPDPIKAREAFKERQAKREVHEEVIEESDEDKPLTTSQFRALMAEERKVSAESQAISVARTFTTNEKRAQLIVAKWKNRSFPSDMSLNEQIEEMAGAVHFKYEKAKNGELIRALKSKDGVTTGYASTQRDGQESPSTKSDVDKAAYTRAGFKYDAKNKVWKKKLPNGLSLIKDPKSKRSWTAKEA